ncbi:hypothetical protein BLNAU_18398 [Blattamonas nauphoetae]|uniref:Uncharacterized protein n=1 Tax=Blattamonas nauphoetae TaxID=2049346 RepID=A0ABQ9X8S8_9EUKA|nr:hypothetical protein BLNAU_18398 [Blattamonas nauphoetae]
MENHSPKQGLSSTYALVPDSTPIVTRNEIKTTIIDQDLQRNKEERERLFMKYRDSWGTPISMRLETTLFEATSILDDLEQKLKSFRNETPLSMTRRSRSHVQRGSEQTPTQTERISELETPRCEKREEEAIPEEADNSRNDRPIQNPNTPTPPPSQTQPTSSERKEEIAESPLVSWQTPHSSTNSPIPQIEPQPESTSVHSLPTSPSNPQTMPCEPASSSVVYFEAEPAEQKFDSVVAEQPDYEDPIALPPGQERIDQLEARVASIENKLDRLIALVQQTVQY